MVLNIDEVREVDKSGMKSYLDFKEIILVFVDKNLDIGRKDIEVFVGKFVLFFVDDVIVIFYVLVIGFILFLLKGFI